VTKIAARDNRGPESALVTRRRLRKVGRTEDLAGNFPDSFFSSKDLFISRSIPSVDDSIVAARVLGVITGDLFVLAICSMLR